MSIELAKAAIDSFKWHMEMRNKKWLSTEQFKKAMRNKKLREQMNRQGTGFDVTNCSICRKTIVSSMSMAIPRKFDRYTGDSVWTANDGNTRKPIMLLCKNCHKENFEEIQSHYDNEQKNMLAVITKQPHHSANLF